MSGRTITVVTGSRAEFGLLRPVMRAIRAHQDLTLQVLVTGEHLRPPAHTAREVESGFAEEIAATIPMHDPQRTGRAAEAESLGRGISGLASALVRCGPDVVLVLGDRIEAFAAASAASVAGVRVAHMHGGDRAAGIVDEALRHAVTKLAHLHLPATAQSAQRIIAMGEDPHRVHVVGSPAIDALDAIAPLVDERFEALGRPKMVFLLHPAGGTEHQEHEV
ncbi:MAG: UDP-N-acetylglucosamine 2-epimerase, partial [Planctomycetota bacterium]